MNAAEKDRDARIRAMDAGQLLRELLDSDDLGVVERKAFEDWMERDRSLTPRERAWAEEAMRRVMPLNSSLVPRGKEVVTPDVLRNLPKRPPGAK